MMFISVRSTMQPTTSPDSHWRPNGSLPTHGPRHVASPNQHVLAADDVVSCCLDLSVPSISFRINGFPVQGMARFLLGGRHGDFKFMPPPGYAPCYEALLPKDRMHIEPIKEYKNDCNGVRSLLGPTLSLNHTSFTPCPVDTIQIVLPPNLERIREKLAENIHELWAVTRIEQGWTYASFRDDNKKLHPCLVDFQSLPEPERNYNLQMSAETLKTLLALGCHDILNKRNPRLVPYVLLDERTKKTNRDSVNNAVRTLIGYGYNIEPPDQESTSNDLENMRGDKVRIFRAEKSYAVTQGKWYFEFEAVTTGEMRVGWARPHVRADTELGADELAYVFNGNKAQRWHVGNEPFGRQWLSGDVVGCMKLAENIHELWAVTRIEQGWTYASFRDDNKKLHPCLVDFQSLPEPERNYNLQMSAETLKTLLALGCHGVKEVWLRDSVGPSRLRTPLQSFLYSLMGSMCMRSLGSSAS
ncbi:hypothetical protein CRUP_027103 [Coryphaenoides rupestris]|nr:hypothetical protein CRUP_027103 [Coryphaenoides rupestris]